MITKQSRALSLLTLTLAGAWAGCDPQADPSYLGESLLSIQGSITTNGNALAPDVVPALAWLIGVENGDFERVRVQETEVRGEFPNSFTMNVISPPPADALRLKSVKGFESEPAVYLGYIVAVPEKHDEEIVLGYEQAPVETTCTPGEGDVEICELTYCDHYDNCFTDRCEGVAADIGGGECTLIEGKPEVKAGLGVAAGFVEDYALIYLDRPAKRGSVTAFMWGVEELSAGYHVIETIGTEEEDYTDVDFACWDAADVEAYAAFEAAYGVSVEDVNDDNPLSDAVWLYQAAAWMDHGCKPQPLASIVVEPKKLVMNLGGLGEE